MAGLRLRRALVLADIESGYGVEATLTDVDSILLANLQIKPMTVKTESRDLVRPYFGNSEQLVVEVNAGASFDVEWAGSGVAGTPPRVGRLLRAAGYSETILAAPITGTAQGGAVGSIQLAVGASATDNAYRNLVLRTTGGTGAGQVRMISAYNGTTKTATVMENFSPAPDATTVYSIDAQVSYAPATDGLESLTLDVNLDGVRHLMTGARASFSLRAAAAGRPMFSFTMMGLYNTITDAAAVLPVYADQAKPLPLSTANTPFFRAHGFAAKLRELSIESGNDVVFRNLVGQESVELTNRSSAGRLQMEAVTVAAKDFWTPAKVAGTGTLALTHGTVAGNICDIHSSRMQLIPPDGYTDSQGIAEVAWGLSFIPTTNGNDEIIFNFR